MAMALKLTPQQQLQIAKMWSGALLQDFTSEPLIDAGLSEEDAEAVLEHTKSLAGAVLGKLPLLADVTSIVNYATGQEKKIAIPNHSDLE